MVISYKLPQIQPGVVQISFMCRSDPTPSLNTSQSSSTSTCPPFFHDPCNQLISLVIDVDALNPNLTSSWTLFVLSKTLLERIPERETTTLTVVAWEDWGPTASRLLADARGPDGYICYIYGYKYAYLFYARGGQFLRVLDFNPYATSRPFPGPAKTVHIAENIRDGENVVSIAIVDKSTIQKDEMRIGFSEEVTTALPYRDMTTRRPLDCHYGGVMIDMERIIGIVVRCLLT